MNYTQWLAYASQLLSEKLLDDVHLDAKFDANMLLQFVTQKSKAQIMAFNESVLDEEKLQKLTALLMRRANGEPIAYILGEQEFWSLNLKVSPATLIPRPDTEILVEKALEIIKSYQNQPHFNDEFRILDLGTGTGAIILALAKELQQLGVNAQCYGVDYATEVIELAKENAYRNQLEVTFLQSDWFSNVQGKFDLIVSNPPYIDERDEHLMQGDVRFEPLSALVAKEQGYADLRHIIQNSMQFLKLNGWLLLEHGWQQGEKVRSIFNEFGWQQINTIKDYGNNERITYARYINVKNKVIGTE